MMIENPDPEKVLNLEGPRAESVFSCLLTWLAPLDRLVEFQKEFDEYVVHYEDLKDERALVLVGALCVEDSLNEMIRAFLPASNILHENRDFTFSLKIDILQACKLIPSRICRHCDLVRKMRNDFAHNLKLKTLSDWGDKKLQIVDKAIKSYHPSHDLSVPHRQRFMAFVAFIGIALRLYTTHVESMREFLDSPDFEKSLRNFKEKVTTP